MKFVVKAPPIQKMLAVLDPDEVAPDLGSPPRRTLTRISAHAGVVSISNANAAIETEAVVDAEGVVFMPTELVREMLESYRGKVMVFSFNLRIDQVGCAMIRFGDRKLAVRPADFRLYGEAAKAPRVPAFTLEGAAGK